MPILKLNKSRPYGQVYGEPGVQWQQDGHYFNIHGALIGDPVEITAEDAQDAEMARPPKGSTEEIGWLRTQLEIYGHPFTTVTAARKFLAGRDE